MKQARGWAARVKRTQENGNEELLAIANDLAASIGNACYLSDSCKPQLHGPTPHMAEAIANLYEWKATHAR